MSLSLQAVEGQEVIGGFLMHFNILHCTAGLLAAKKGIGAIMEAKVGTAVSLHKLDFCLEDGNRTSIVKKETISVVSRKFNLINM